MKMLLLVILFSAGCACHRPQPVAPDPPVRVFSCTFRDSGDECPTSRTMTRWCVCTERL